MEIAHIVAKRTRKAVTHAAERHVRRKATIAPRVSRKEKLGLKPGRGSVAGEKKGPHRVGRKVRIAKTVGKHLAVPAATATVAGTTEAVVRKNKAANNPPVNKTVTKPGNTILSSYIPSQVTSTGSATQATTVQPAVESQQQPVRQQTQVAGMTTATGGNKATPAPVGATHGRGLTRRVLHDVHRNIAKELGKGLQSEQLQLEKNLMDLIFAARNKAV